MKTKLLLFTLMLGLVIAGCSKDEAECDTTDITYTNTIASIFDTSCAVAACHVDGNEEAAFFSLEGYQNSLAAANFGRIVGAVSHAPDFSPMPKGGSKLDECTIDKITAWVDAGAPE